MNLTSHQIRVFIAVSELGSVSKAAQKLHMTQPAVSNILKQLENYYGCKITEVISRKLYLTEYGKILYSSYTDIQNAFDATKNKISALNGLTAGTLKVAVVSTAKYFMPKMLAGFRELYPNINIKLSVMNRQEVIDRLEKNLDDFTVMSYPPDNLNIESKLLYEDELVVVSANTLNIKAHKELTVHDLADFSWLYREKGSGTLFANQKIFKNLEFTPRDIVEIGDNEAIKQSVIAGFGLAVLSRASCKIELRDKLLREVKISGFPVKHNWYIVRNKGKILAPLVEKFFKFLYAQK